jgi:hypothetical protein
MAKHQALSMWGVLVMIVSVLLVLCRFSSFRAEDICVPDPLNRYIQSAIIEKLNSKHCSIDVDLAYSIACSVEEGCEKYNLPPELVLAVMETESNFRPQAKSYMNARGLMGVMGKTPKGKIVWFTRLQQEGILARESDLFTIHANILAGCFILRYYLDEYNGNMKKALFAYVGGQSEKYRVSVAEKKTKFRLLIADKKEFARQKHEDELQQQLSLAKPLEDLCVTVSSWTPAQN